MEKKYSHKSKIFGKHRNIDRSTGVDHIVTFAGSTFKITEFKLRPQKPRPKSYPDKDKEGPVEKEDEKMENKNEENGEEDVKQEIEPQENQREVQFL